MFKYIIELEAANANFNVEISNQKINNVLKPTCGLYELLTNENNNIENDIMHSELNIVENNSEKSINSNSENDDCLNEMSLSDSDSDDNSNKFYLNYNIIFIIIPVILYKKIKYFKFIGDFTEDDFEIPEGEDMHYSVYAHIVKVKNNKIRKYQQTISSYANRINFLRKVIDDFKCKNNPIANYGYQQLSKVNILYSYIVKS